MEFANLFYHGCDAASSIRAARVRLLEDVLSAAEIRLSIETSREIAAEKH
jgi:hypothetical protein